MLSIIESLEDIANWIKKTVFRSPTDIWTNPNPNAAMASIVVWKGDVMKYERFEIECDVTVNETERRKVTIELYPGANTWAFFPGNFDTNFIMHMYGRVFYTDSRGICCGPGRDQGFNMSGANTYNHLLVPQRITGFKTLGGGYCVTWLGGGLRAKLKTVLARCSQRLAEDFRWHAKRQFENWITTDSMGKYVDDYSFWSECSRQIYRFSSEIFTYSCCVWTMHLQHKLSGFVQYHNKHYFNNSFFDGIQEQLCDKVYNPGCLDRNRQSVTPRGCCHV